MKRAVFVILLLFASCGLYAGGYGYSPTYYYTLSVGTITATGNVTANSLVLSSDTSSATNGIIFKGSDKLLHTYSHSTATGRNTFLGLFSGNTTMSPAGGAADLSSYLTGLGYHTLLSVTTGYNLTAAGAGAMQQATTSVSSSAFGVHSLYSLTEGLSDNAFGHYAGYATVGGDYNNYFGENAGYGNVSGSGNLAAGHNTLYTATDDDYNTALGMESLKLATLGNNTAGGAYSLGALGAGYDHSAFGVSAGRTVTGGNTSSFFGFNAGYHASQKVDPVNSTAIGNGSYTTADNQVVIGNTSVTETQLHGNIYGDNFIPDKFTADAPRPSGWPQTAANANDHEFTGETLMLTGTCNVVHNGTGTSTVTSTAGAVFDAGDDGKYLVLGNAAYVIDSVTSASAVEVTEVGADPINSTGTAYRIQRTGYWLFYDATHVTGGAVEPSTFNQTALPGYFTAANGGSVSAGFFMKDYALGTADFTYTIKMAQPSYGSYCALAFTDASNDGNCFGMWWNGHFDTFRSVIADFAISGGTYTAVTAYSYFQYIQVRRRSNAISLAGSPDGVTWVMILGEGTVTMANDITKVGIYYSTAAAAYPSPASVSVDFIRKQ